MLDALESRGALDDTVIIFLSDHGEMLVHKGRLWKGRMLYDHLVRVPFILRYPREIRGGQIISDMVQATDIMPTILDYAGISGATGIQGRSIRRLLRKETLDWRQWAFAEAGGVKMARTHRWKLIHYAGKSYGELFNLEADPLELENLYDRPEYALKRAEMTQLLVNILIETEDPLPEAALGTPYEGIAGRPSAARVWRPRSGRVPALGRSLRSHAAGRQIYMKWSRISASVRGEPVRGW